MKRLNMSSDPKLPTAGEAAVGAVSTERLKSAPAQKIRSTQGSEIVEAALVLPLLFMVVMAIFWFGQAYRIYGTITYAARAGARAAVAPVCATCAAPTSTNTPTQNAVNAVNTILSNGSLSTAQVKWPASPPPFATCSGGASATCDGNATNICVEANVELSTKTLSAPGTCGTVVSFTYQYPYHFAIPYTSLDLGNIALPAQAQMRLETQ
jgi:Flp pilus assembly protein TadG